MVMDFIKSLKTLINVENVQTVNNVFKLHYKVTVPMLIIFSIILTSKQYFGNPIVCDAEHKKEVIEAYCFLQGTFVVEATIANKNLGGLGLEGDKALSWQEYYQWISIIFCVQALCFYLPYYLWRSWEAEQIKFIVKDLGGPLLSAAWTKSKKEALINYISTGKCLHNIYAGRYVLCEILNFANVVGQIFFIDWLLTNRFSLYGFTSLTAPVNTIMKTAFPIRAKCSYHKFGYSGSEEIRDAICILSLNTLNQKLFVILWFWYIFLTAVSFLAIVYRIVLILFPIIRAYLLVVQTRCIQLKKLKFIITNLDYGNFFVLYHIGKNMNPISYQELVRGIHDHLEQTTIPKKGKNSIEV